MTYQMTPGEWLERWAKLDPLREEVSAAFDRANNGDGPYNTADEMAADLREDEAELAAHASEIISRLSQAHFFCAECGTTENGVYVVTILDQDNPEQERTEVCLDCDRALHAQED